MSVALMADQLPAPLPVAAPQGPAERVIWHLYRTPPRSPAPFIAVRWRATPGQPRALCDEPIPVPDLAAAHRSTPRHLPLTRAECVNGPRPCPFASCRHHLAFDVLPDGRLKENRPKSASNCSLDAAERGGMTQAEVAAELGVSEDWVGQIERAAQAKVRDQFKAGAQ